MSRMDRHLNAESVERDFERDVESDQTPIDWTEKTVVDQQRWIKFERGNNGIEGYIYVRPDGLCDPLEWR